MGLIVILSVAYFGIQMIGNSVKGNITIVQHGEKVNEDQQRFFDIVHKSNNGTLIKEYKKVFHPSSKRLDVKPSLNKLTFNIEENTTVTLSGGVFEITKHEIQKE